MSKTLTEIARQLKDAEKRVQLIYAFNGTGKTRLSREFKQLIAPKADGNEDDDEADQPELARNRILYYNAFTEDLFYWDNDLELDAEPKLKIQPNSFTDWVLRAIAFTPAEPIQAMKPDSLEFGQPFCGGYAGYALDSADPAVTRSGRTCARPTGFVVHGLCGLGNHLHGT